MSSLARILLVLSLIGCGDDRAAAIDARPSDDGLPGDGAPDSLTYHPFIPLATFDPALQQLPEGVVSANGAVYVGLAPLGQIVKLTQAGSFAPFGALPGPVSNTYTLGLAANAAGDIFVAVAASGANPTPAPGVYRIPAAGGTAQVFSTSPLMTFPNGIAVDGTTLYVTDSAAGRIFQIGQNGAASVWLEHPMLAGSTSACGGTGAPFAIGANGIAHDGRNLYVAVTDHGRIVRVPILMNGRAGTPVVHLESCADLQGVDGILAMGGGELVIVRNGPSNMMSWLHMDGTAGFIHAGAPLDGPASITFHAGVPGFVITNSAFFSGAAGRPSVVAMSIAIPIGSTAAPASPARP